MWSNSYFDFRKLWFKLLFLQTRGAEHSPWEPRACPSCPTATANRAGNISCAVLREYNFHYLPWFIATDDWLRSVTSQTWWCLSVCLSGWKLSGGGQAAVLHRHVVSCVFAAGRSSCGNQLWTPVLWWDPCSAAANRFQNSFCVHLCMHEVWPVFLVLLLMSVPSQAPA